MKQLKQARSRLEQIMYDCQICGSAAVDKGEARAWRAIANIAAAGLAESAEACSVTRHDGKEGVA